MRVNESRHRQAGQHSVATGFTLLELLLVLSIIGLLLSVGLPAYRNHLQAQQLATSADQFLFALKLARSEAVLRRTRVDLAPRAGQNWNDGWLVFINKAGDSNLQYDAGDQLLHSYEQLPAQLRVHSTLRDRANPYIAYNGSGRTRTNSGPLVRQWGSLQFSLGDHARRIVLNIAGRVRLCNPAKDKSCESLERVHDL